MITQREISQLAYREGISEKVIEKDYCLTWLLTAIAESSFSDILAFKGGTAIKKIYFPDYRYSEDLDFTVLAGTDPEQLITETNKVLRLLSKSQGFQFAIPEEKIERRSDSLTLYINYVGPLQARLDSRLIKVDFTLSEKLLFPIDKKPIHSSYSDATESKPFPTYSLEEILTEKLCAIIGRTEPRDIYDAAFLFDLDLDFYRIPDAFREKVAFKGIDHKRISTILDEKKSKFSRMWQTRLADQIKDLPHMEEIMRRLQRDLKEHIVF